LAKRKESLVRSKLGDQPRQGNQPGQPDRK
jgi:hypothetical protein